MHCRETSQLIELPCFILAPRRVRSVSSTQLRWKPGKGHLEKKKMDERKGEVIEGVILSTVNTVSVITVTIKRKLC